MYFFEITLFTLMYIYGNYARSDGVRTSDIDIAYYYIDSSLYLLLLVFAYCLFHKFTKDVSQSILLYI